MKEVIHNGDFIKESDEAKSLYNKTHGASDPGQQKDRNYKWKFDKNNHVFGFKFPLELDGAKNSLETDHLNSKYPQTVLVKKNLEDFRQFNTDMLGRTKYRGALNKNLPEDFAFGVKTIVGENWNVGINSHKL